jgi:hypothetical protein
MGSLTRSELESEGLTAELAEQWRDYYQEVARLTPQNESARGRAELMQYAADLLQNE